MKDKEIRVRADEDFVKKVDYLKQINRHKNRSDTIRKVVEKEFMKEEIVYDDLHNCGLCQWFDGEYCTRDREDMWTTDKNYVCSMFLRKEKEDDKS
jgi:hypothetical protein